VNYKTLEHTDRQTDRQTQTERERERDSSGSGRHVSAAMALSL